MSRTQITLLALLSLAALSCEKENSVINKLEGKWNVSELQFSGYSQKDSVVKVTETSIEFAVCNASKNKSSGDAGCRVYITENAQRYELVYQVDANKQLGNTVYLNGVAVPTLLNDPAYQKILKKWNMRYQIIEASRNNLVIVRNYDCSQTNGVQDCNKMKVTASR